MRIRRADGDVIHAGTLGFRGRPLELARRGVDRRAGGKRLPGDRLEAVCYHVLIAGRSGERQQRQLVDSLVADIVQLGRVVDGDLERAGMLSHTVADAQRDRVVAGRLRRRRRPSEYAAVGIDAGPVGRTGIEAERERVGRHVAVGDRGREAERVAAANDEIADLGQHRRRVYLADGDLKRSLVGQSARVGRPHRHPIHAGALRFAGRPLEQAGRRTDGRAVGKRLAGDGHKRVGHRVGIVCKGGKRQRHKLVHGLVVDAVQRRRGIHGDLKRLKCIQSARVAHANGDAECARTERGVGGPIEAGRRVTRVCNGRAGREGLTCDGQQFEGERVHVAGRDDEAQQRAAVDGLVFDRRQQRPTVHGDIEGDRRAIARQVDRLHGDRLVPDVLIRGGK